MWPVAMLVTHATGMSTNNGVMHKPINGKSPTQNHTGTQIHPPKPETRLMTDNELFGRALGVFCMATFYIQNKNQYSPCVIIHQLSAPAGDSVQAGAQRARSFFCAVLGRGTDIPREERAQKRPPAKE